MTDNTDNKKIKLKQAIVVEGRDDIDAVSRAFDTLIIATHGFGIREETWALIKKAHDEKGIIVLTDPDHSGEEIRKKITERFPDALQAYVPRELATKDGDIGVENSSPEVIAEAVARAHAEAADETADPVSVSDMDELGLSGRKGSRELREEVGAELGIGYGSTKAMIRKLRAFGIGYDELAKTVAEIKNRK
jgi:ribonuclease M5